MNPKYPVYIVSKGRWTNNITSNALNRMHVPHYVVVEAHEYANYSKTIKGEVIILPSRS